MATAIQKISANAKPHTPSNINGIFPFTQAVREIGEAQRWSNAASEAFSESMLEAMRNGSLQTRNSLTGLPNNILPDIVLHLVHPDDVNKWLESKGMDYRWLNPSIRVSATGVAVVGAVGSVSVPSGMPLVNQNIPSQPWCLHNSNDPKPVQPWYTPARYFARQLVKDDSTLLTKKPTLARKVSASLASAGIYKRGGKKPPDSATILKAFSNVTLG